MFSVPPAILDNPTCDDQSEVLKCVCVSKGIPLPTISWLLDRHSNYSFTTTVSNPTVTSTLTVPVKGHNNTTVWCVSRSDFGEVKKNTTVNINQQHQDKQQEGKCNDQNNRPTLHNCHILTQDTLKNVPKTKHCLKTAA